MAQRLGKIEGNGLFRLEGCNLHSKYVPENLYFVLKKLHISKKIIIINNKNIPLYQNFNIFQTHATVG